MPNPYKNPAKFAVLKTVEKHARGHNENTDNIISDLPDEIVIPLTLGAVNGQKAYDKKRSKIKASVQSNLSNMVFDDLSILQHPVSVHVKIDRIK